MFSRQTNFLELKFCDLFVVFPPTQKTLKVGFLSDWNTINMDSDWQSWKRVTTKKLKILIAYHLSLTSTHTHTPLQTERRTHTQTERQIHKHTLTQKSIYHKHGNFIHEYIFGNKFCFLKTFEGNLYLQYKFYHCFAICFVNDSFFECPPMLNLALSLKKNNHWVSFQATHV